MASIYKWLRGRTGEHVHAVPDPAANRPPLTGPGSGITHGALCGRWLLPERWATSDDGRCGHCLRLVLSRDLETTN